MTRHEPRHAAERRAAILAAIPPEGASIAQIAEAVGIKQSSAQQRLSKYAKAGHIFIARVKTGNSGAAQGWYFKDCAARDALQAQCSLKARPKKQSGWIAHKGAKDMAAANPHNVQPIQLSSSFRHRHTADPQNLPERPFSSLRPGQYLAPAPVWLQGVAA